MYVIVFAALVVLRDCKRPVADNGEPSRWGHASSLVPCLEAAIGGESSAELLYSRATKGRKPPVEVQSPALTCGRAGARGGVGFALPLLSR